MSGIFNYMLLQVFATGFNLIMLQCNRTIRLRYRALVNII